MTPKQRRFAEEYMIDLNQTQAAIRAGFSARTAKQQASRVIAIPAVRDYIAAIGKEALGRNQVTFDRVITELAAIGFSDIRNAVEWSRVPLRTLEDTVTGETVTISGNDVRLRDSATLDGNTAAAISEVTRTADGAIKVKFHPKIPALQAMLRRLVPEAPKAAGATDGRQNVTPSDGWGDLLRTVN